MLELIITIFCVWLFFKTLGLAFRVTWGLTKLVASLLFAVALPLLVGCLLFAGGPADPAAPGTVGYRLRSA